MSKKMIGHAALLVVVVGIMAANATILYDTERTIMQEKHAAEQAAKPATIELTFVSAPDCKECFKVEQIATTIARNPSIAIVKQEAIEYTSDQGVELIKQYNITRVPAILIRGEIEKAFGASSSIEQLGVLAQDGTLMVRNVPAPYIELPSGALKGRFTVTYLSDAACKECYEVSLHRNALAALAMVPSEETFVDRSQEDGTRLIVKYGITSLPTVLITGDLALYTQFQQVWPQVGTVEKDGMHVFRAGQQLMGAYKDLKTGKVVKQEQAPQPTQQGQ